ncbi:MAG TPA: hypothetical protein DD417_07305, partial [Elusimicrobia bacterium]|nr:hypothetical protein [Elusimicrobiota bacterium]
MGGIENPYSVAWGDYDGDGFPDLAVGNANGTGPNRVYRNEGNGSFTPVWSDGAGGAQFTYHIQWADMDGDGRLDLVMAILGNNSRVYRNNGDGSFTSIWSGGSGSDVGGAVGDYDNDGDLDLALSGSMQLPSVYANPGSGNLSLAWQGPDVMVSFGSAWADVDNDGRLDLAVGGNGSPTRIYRNDGVGAFSEVWRSTETGAGTRIAFADADGNGGLDLAVGNYDGVTQRLYGGFRPSVNTPPTAPGGVSASFEYGQDLSTLTIKWARNDLDSKGNPDTLYYAVTVSTVFLMPSADGMRIVDPSSMSANRFILSWNEGSPLLGAGLRPAYKVWPGDGTAKYGVTVATASSLSGGPLAVDATYYFRVQAIDAGLARSTWSWIGMYYVPHPCATRTSQNSGSWFNPTIWSAGMAPTSCSDVIVQAGHTVDVVSWNAISSGVVVLGTMTFSRASHSGLTLMAGDLQVRPGGYLDLGTEANPIPAGTTAQLVLAPGAGPLRYGLIVNDGGMFTAHGAAKAPFAYAFTDIPANGTNVEVWASSAALWQVGDRVTIGPVTGTGTGSTDERALTQIDDLGATKRIHWSGGVAARVLTSSTPVPIANLTRNVLIRSSGTVLDPAAGDTAFLRNEAGTPGAFRLKQTELAYLGTGNTDQEGVVFTGAARGSISSSTVRNGYSGIENGSTGANEFTNNMVYANTLSGMYNEGGGGAGTVIYGNHFVGNTQRGLRLASVSGLLITENRMYSNTLSGISVSLGGLHKIKGNNSHSNGGYGIRVMGGSYLDIEENLVYVNVSTGIRLMYGTAVGNRLVANWVASNLGEGIGFDSGASSSVVKGNYLAWNGGAGVSLSYSKYDSIYQNTIVYNSGHGIKVADASTGNRLVGNDI